MSNTRQWERDERVGEGDETKYSRLDVYEADRRGETNTSRGTRETSQLLCSNSSEAFIRLHCSTGFPKSRHPGDTVSRLNKPPGSFWELMKQKQSGPAPACALILCRDQLLGLEGARAFFGNERRPESPCTCRVRCFRPTR